MSALKPRDLGLSYSAACHGMQSAVAFEHEHNPNDGSPKHLRVGVNSAFVNDAALAQLLIAKGLFTIEEYLESIRVQMNEELARYEERLRVAYNLPPHMSFR